MPIPEWVKNWIDQLDDPAYDDDEPPIDTNRIVDSVPITIEDLITRLSANVPCPWHTMPCDCVNRDDWE